MRVIQTPASRVSDPLTSHDAEAAINANGSRARQQHLVADLVNQYPNHTCCELAVYGLLTERQLSRRLPEAVAAGAIEKGGARVCTVTGHRAHTYHPKAAQRSLF